MTGDTIVNNLNSILLEGTVSGTPCVDGKGGAKRCSFVLSSLRCEKDGKRIKKQETRVWIQIRRADMVERAVKSAYDGRGARVVGRIASDEDGCIYLEAEHVEYRPEFDRKTKKE